MLKTSSSVSMSHKLRVGSLKMWSIQVQWGSNERCYHTELMRWYLPWGAISRDGSSRRNPRTVLSLWFTLFETSVIWYILCHPDRLCTATRSNRSIQQLGWTCTDLVTKTHLHTFIAWYLGIHTLRLSEFSGFGDWTIKVRETSVPQRSQIQSIGRLLVLISGSN